MFVRQNVEYLYTAQRSIPDKKNFECAQRDLRIVLTDGTWTPLNLQRCVLTLRPPVMKIHGRH